MRVLSCKIHWPSFTCFCKPSASTHCYNSGSLNLENSTHVPCNAQKASHQLSHVAHQIQVREELEDKLIEDLKQEGGARVLRSSIKKVSSVSSVPAEKKKVQWVDSLGKQLVDIKEFESSETGDTEKEAEENGGDCLCNIF